jgi:hypothetical protein
VRAGSWRSSQGQGSGCDWRPSREVGEAVHVVSRLTSRSAHRSRNPRLVQRQDRRIQTTKSISFIAEDEMPRTATGSFCTGSPEQVRQSRSARSAKKCAMTSPTKRGALGRRHGKNGGRSVGGRRSD